MKTVVLFVVLSCCAVSALSLAGVQKSKPSATVAPAHEFNESPTPIPTTTPTTANTTTTPTTANTTTTPTTANTTTTTTASTTTASTTTKATTTTTASTTTASTTTKATTTTASTTTASTTTKATTTTTASTTTTTPKTTTASPGPTPPTNVTRGEYSLKNKSEICLMANMALQIRYEPKKANGNYIVQPNQTKPLGWCKDTESNLTMSFNDGCITFIFNKNTTTSKVYINTVTLALSYSFVKGEAKTTLINTNTSLNLFPAKLGHSYSCRNQSVYMGNGLYLEVTQAQMQAFDLPKDKGFSSPDFCPADQPNYSVAIGVGVALLILIIIVVVVYLVSRRRRTDGYQSL